MGEPRGIVESGGLEIEFSPEHERREFRVQRVAWALMGLAIVAALAGLFGPGPLSRAQAGETGGRLRAEFQRFARYQGPLELRIFCRPENAHEFRVSLDRSFFEHAEIREISPQPHETVSGSNYCTLAFTSEGGGEHLVTIRFESRKVGKRSYGLRLDGGHEIEVQQFFWP